MSKALTSENFEAEVVNSDVPVLVDFYTDWCGPCKAAAPILDELEAKHGAEFKIVKVNAEAAEELATRFSVSALPTFLVFRNGEVVRTFRGLQRFDSLLQALRAAV